MIERFNFYDVYGYILPGAVVALLVGLPHWIEGNFPAINLGSTIPILVAVYAAGLLVQRISQRLVPSKDGSRYPSAILLDIADKRLSRALKRSLARKIESRMELDVGLEAHGPECDVVRQNAFFLCRTVLIGKGRARYAEQFEGLYALMRGLTATFAIGAAYYLDIGFQAAVESRSSAFDPWFVFALLLWAAAATSHPDPGPSERWVEGIAAVITFVLGGAKVAASYELLRGVGPFVGLLACLIACIKCYQGYRYWADEFAKTVWRDYAIADEEAAEKKKAKSDG